MITEINITAKQSEIDGLYSEFLRNKVFHVTSRSNAKKIISDGMIRVNLDKEHSFSMPQSINSYGRKRGYVCLFDYKSAQMDEINESIYKFHYISIFDNQPTFFIIKKSLSEELIPWTKPKEENNYRDVLIPYVECWYPGNLSLVNIVTIVNVDVIT